MAAGRPREFDYDQALDRAMHVFWSKGYEGTTMPDLTEAMNMNRPSIYAAFGNKQELFRKALERYTEASLQKFRDLLAPPRLHDALEQFLLGTAEGFANGDCPRGCFSVQAALVGGTDSKDACQYTLEQRELIVGVLKDRIAGAISQGELPPATDAAELARFYTTILQGMSVQSVGGLGCAELKSIARRALLALPTI